MDTLGKAVGGTTAYRMDWIIIISNKTDNLKLQIMDKDGYNSSLIICTLDIIFTTFAPTKFSFLITVNHTLILKYTAPSFR